jgi:hypothetical protein
MIRLCLIAAAVFFTACAKPDASSSAKGAGATTASARAATGSSSCPATGLWANCSLLYRLERAGLAPQVDSSAKPAELALVGKPLVVKIGKTATLELYVYPDSAARIADGAKLDRKQFVDAVAEQTVARERTLIETANVIGLLTSLSSHQRERVSDAIMAGPPQPKP